MDKCNKCDNGHKSIIDTRMKCICEYPEGSYINDDGYVVNKDGETIL